MNLNINPALTTTIAADRLRTLGADAEIARLRKTARRARRDARTAAAAGRTDSADVAATTPAPLAAVTTLSAPTTANTFLASSDLEHASARVA